MKRKFSWELAKYVMMDPLTGRVCFHTNIDCSDGMPGHGQLVKAMAEVSAMNSVFGTYLLYLALGVPVQRDDDADCDFGDEDKNEVEDPFDPEGDEDDSPDEKDPDGNR